VIDEHGRLEGQRIGGVAPVRPFRPGAAHRQVARLRIAVVGELHLQVHRRRKGKIRRPLAGIGLAHDPVVDLPGQHILVSDGHIGIGLLEPADHRLRQRLVERRIDDKHRRMGIARYRRIEHRLRQGQTRTEQQTDQKWQSPHTGRMHDCPAGHKRAAPRTTERQHRCTCAILLQRRNRRPRQQPPKALDFAQPTRLTNLAKIAEDALERRLTAILAADVVGYSRLMGIDEAGTLEAVNRHRIQIIEPAISSHNGRLVKLLGDGLLVEFPSVVNAVACAVDIQRGGVRANEGVAEERRIRFRIGVNLGDVIVEGGDIFGDGVNVAARLEAIAAPGGIAVSSSVRDHVGTRLDLRFEDRGRQALKNIRQEVHVYAVLFDHPDDTPAPGAPAADDRSIVVLPFTNMSGDPDQEYFSDGLTEDIITDLSKISGLLVIPRNTTFAYKGRAVKIGQIGRELSVRYILQGSVRKSGERVRISAQMIDAGNEDHLWADRYDRDLTDIFAIQDEIAHAIVGQLKIKLRPEEIKALESDPTTNVEAYTYYLRGRKFARTMTMSYLTLARRMFSKAVELDPDYARAYAGIADCDSALYIWYAAELPIDEILEMTEKALTLDPISPKPTPPAPSRSTTTTATRRQTPISPARWN
jgi:TolB-like protein/class 3 adenylate cyclase